MKESDRNFRFWVKEERHKKQALVMPYTNKIGMDE